VKKEVKLIQFTNLIVRNPKGSGLPSKNVEVSIKKSNFVLMIFQPD